MKKIGILFVICIVHFLSACGGDDIRDSAIPLGDSSFTLVDDYSPQPALDRSEGTNYDVQPVFYLDKRPEGFQTKSQRLAECRGGILQQLKTLKEQQMQRQQKAQWCMETYVPDRSCWLSFEDRCIAMRENLSQECRELDGELFGILQQLIGLQEQYNNCETEIFTAALKSIQA